MRLKAQSLMEYIVLFGCMIIALVGMEVYLKRGISGGIKTSADSLGRQFDPNWTVFDDLTTRNRGDSRTEAIVRTEVNGTEERFFTDTYTVSGPGEVRDETGNPIIAADPSRQPDNTTVGGRETINLTQGRLFENWTEN